MKGHLMQKRLSAALLLTFSVNISFQLQGAEVCPPKNRVRELGEIKWLRSFDEAVGAAKTANRPLLILFQEVPGCETCVSYGDRVLSHPLIVEAAETLFAPVAIYNNVEGPDKVTLDSFKEAAWANPVVRIVAVDRTELAPRVAGDYTVAGLAEAMVKGLKKAGQIVPVYLNLLAEESIARRRGVERTTFAMHCFWEGEAALGALTGIISTTPGFIGELEVVDVEFDPQVISLETLVRTSHAKKCASRVFTHNENQQKTAVSIVGVENVSPIPSASRPDKTAKYYLANSPYKHVPMTATQASRVNAALGLKQDPKAFLSPRQNGFLDLVQKHPQAPWPRVFDAENMARAWGAVLTVAAASRN